MSDETNTSENEGGDERRRGKGKRVVTKGVAHIKAPGCRPLGRDDGRQGAVAARVPRLGEGRR